MQVMPGVTVRWANDAREGLREVTDAYLRRRAKARIEKYARTRKLPVITKEVAFPLIEETVGRDKLGACREMLVGDMIADIVRGHVVSSSIFRRQ